MSSSSDLPFVMDLLHWTVEDLKNWRVFEVRDPFNLTIKHFEKLRDLGCERDQMTLSNAVDAEELEAKLRGVSSRSASRSTSTPGPDDPIEIEKDLRAEQEAFDTLIREGGRPSHPISLGFDALKEPREYKEIVSYWNINQSMFEAQLREWGKFRDYQQKARRYYGTVITFPNYQHSVQELRQKYGLHSKFKLHRERDKQSRLDTWVEYQYYNYRKFGQFKERVEQAQKKLELARTKLSETGAAGLEEHKTNSFSYGLQHGQQDEEAYKLIATEQEMELAKRRLSTVEPNNLTERATLIRLAQEDVHLVQNQLNETKKWEDLVRIREGVLTAQRRLRSATIDLKRHKILLGWIDQQLLMIISECADSNQRNKSSTSHYPGQGKMSKSVSSLKNGTSAVPEFKNSPERSKRISKEKGNLIAQPLLSLARPSKVSKGPGKKGYQLHRKKSISHSTLSPPRARTSDQCPRLDIPLTLNIALRRSKRIANINGNRSLPESASSIPFDPVRSSTVSKATAGKVSRTTRSSTQEHADDVYSLRKFANGVRPRYKQEKKLDAVTLSPRRSRRISENVKRSTRSK